MIDKKKVLMVVYSYFPQDPRPRREAEALIKAGYSVDILCLRYDDQVREETVYGVKVFRLNMKRSRTSKRKYVSLYSTFFVKAFLKLNSLYFRYRYSVIHVHNMPDFLVFLAIIPKLLGSKVVLDLHDPSPEILMTKYTEHEESFLTRILKWQEKISIKFAHMIITTNKSFVDRFVSRGCPPAKINIVMNSPQTSVFNKAIRLNNNGIKNEFILMYHGIVVERHGLDTLLYAVNMLRNKISGIKLIVYGDGEFVPKFLELVKKLEIDDIVKYHGSVPIEEIAEIISGIDLGVIPNRLNPFTKINFPTRIFEYLCMKKPVIVPRTQGIEDYFTEEEIFYFNSGNEKDLAAAILKIYADLENTKSVVDKGFHIYEKYNWENQSKELVNIYKKVLA